MTRLTRLAGNGLAAAALGVALPMADGTTLSAVIFVDGITILYVQ